MPNEFDEELAALKLIVYDPKESLAVRLHAWSKWCKLFDKKEAAEKVQADACKEHAL